MESDDTQWCSVEGCTAARRGHQWGKIKSGWFELKDGTLYCPDHIPAWVATWRKKAEPAS